MAVIYITSKKLIETLKITGAELQELEQFIDSDPDDEWELTEGTDYKIVVAAMGLREYTETGAFAIAECLEFRRAAKQGWFRKLIRELITAIRGNIRNAFVREKILNNSSSLALNNNRYFLSSRDVTAIFGTRPDYLRKMATEAQKQEQPLIKDEDYIEIPDEGIYYALQGLSKLAKVFADSLKDKNRKDWCSDVGKVIDPSIKSILHQLEKRNSDIASAVSRAKQRAGRRCQVTGKRGTPAEPIPMAGHHLYSRAEYPHLVASVDNIICITCEVHDHFHQTLGGKNRPCTLDDFEQFVKAYYPESQTALIWLHQKRLILGNQQSNTQNHVLNLPWPIPKLLAPAKPNSSP